MKILVCLGFMTMVLGAQAGPNDPPLNIFATLPVHCVVATDCIYGVQTVTEGFGSKCISGTQPSCVQQACVFTAPQYFPCSVQA